MCYICMTKALYSQDSLESAAEAARFLHGMALIDKLTTALPVDGVGDLKPPVALPGALITTDDVPDAADTAGGTNPVLAVTGPGVTTPIVSTIDTIGDQDFYQVTLTAGTTYEIGLYAFNGGPNLVGLTDAYMELYAADGTTLVVSADGGAPTLYNELNSGFDVLLTYTPTVSGTFYVNARAYSNSALTPTGDSVGDYELFAREQDPNDPNIYTPYYAPDDPLYALDWGTQVGKVNQSARNPDGDEGPRDTGNDQGTPVLSSEFDVAALAADQGKDITGKNVITIYFAKAGDVFVSNDPTNPGLPPATITAVAPQAFEVDAVWTSLREFEKVADVVYVEVQDRDQADFVYTSYQGTPGPGISLLGSMSPPGESDEGLAQFNSGDYRWNATDLQQGGFSFVTLIHEFGHGHGLAHPHDNGGRSGIMNGVEPEGAGVADYTTGDFALNQGVFTMMSYEDGWQSSPYGNAPTDVGYGYLGGLMAFDIAAIQDKYGVNEDWATGDDLYRLKDVNAAGTFYSSIWDAGGEDTIIYSGAREATIDLRPATLEYEEGGGGRVSYADGIFGGFTIANDVIIENATGGSGNDTLIGNDAVNALRGRAGDDSLSGGGGGDLLIGGDGSDLLYGELGSDVLRGQGGEDTLWGGLGHDDLFGGDGADTLQGDGGNDRIYGNADADFVNGGAGDDNLFGGLGDDSVHGGNGADILNGQTGDDLIVGGPGNDLLSGGTGADRFLFNPGHLGGGLSATDRIKDFSSAQGDKIDLHNLDADTNSGGDQAFSWIGGAAFSGTAGELRFAFAGNTTTVTGDTDGDGAADFALWLTGQVALTEGDFVL
jgi:serralysin